MDISSNIKIDINGLIQEAPALPTGRDFGTSSQPINFKTEKPVVDEEQKRIMQFHNYNPDNPTDVERWNALPQNQKDTLTEQYYQAKNQTATTTEQGVATDPTALSQGENQGQDEVPVQNEASEQAASSQNETQEISEEELLKVMQFYGVFTRDPEEVAKWKARPQSQIDKDIEIYRESQELRQKQQTITFKPIPVPEVGAEEITSRIKLKLFESNVKAELPDKWDKMDLNQKQRFLTNLLMSSRGLDWENKSKTEQNKILKEHNPLEEILKQIDPDYEKYSKNGKADALNDLAVDLVIVLNKLNGKEELTNENIARAIEEFRNQNIEEQYQARLDVISSDIQAKEERAEQRVQYNEALAEYFEADDIKNITAEQQLEFIENTKETFDSDFIEGKSERLKTQATFEKQLKTQYGVDDISEIPKSELRAFIDDAVSRGELSPKEAATLSRSFHLEEHVETTRQAVYDYKKNIQTMIDNKKLDNKMIQAYAIKHPNEQAPQSLDADQELEALLYLRENGSLNAEEEAYLDELKFICQNATDNAKENQGDKNILEVFGSDMFITDNDGNINFEKPSKFIDWVKTATQQEIDEKAAQLTRHQQRELARYVLRAKNRKDLSQEGYLKAARACGITMAAHIQVSQQKSGEPLSTDDQQGLAASMTGANEKGQIKKEYFDEFIEGAGKTFNTEGAAYLGHLLEESGDSELLNLFNQSISERDDYNDIMKMISSYEQPSSAKGKSSSSETKTTTSSNESSYGKETSPINYTAPETKQVISNNNNNNIVTNTGVHSAEEAISQLDFNKESDQQRLVEIVSQDSSILGKLKPQDKQAVLEIYCKRLDGAQIFQLFRKNPSLYSELLKYSGEKLNLYKDEMFKVLFSKSAGNMEKLAKELGISLTTFAKHNKEYATKVTIATKNATLASDILKNAAFYGLQQGSSEHFELLSISNSNRKVENETPVYSQRDSELIQPKYLFKA